MIYGGAGNDYIDGGYGNDKLRGVAGNDTISGDVGADTLIGGTGDDALNDGAISDDLFGDDGDDFLNGGFGHDRLLGGNDADKFYHAGVIGHGTDWVQDYNAAAGDVLVIGDPLATIDDFYVQAAYTANAGLADVRELFIVYEPSNTVLWALVDGELQGRVNIQIGNQVYGLLDGGAG